MQQTSLDLEDYRCFCGKLLFRGSLSEGTVEVKCKNCHQLLSFLGEGSGKEPSAAVIED